MLCLLPLFSILFLLLWFLLLFTLLGWTLRFHLSCRIILRCLLLNDDLLLHIDHWSWCSPLQSLRWTSLGWTPDYVNNVIFQLKCVLMSWYHSSWTHYYIGFYSTTLHQLLTLLILIANKGDIIMSRPHLFVGSLLVVHLLIRYVTPVLLQSDWSIASICIHLKYQPCQIQQCLIILICDLSNK